MSAVIAIGVMPGAGGLRPAQAGREMVLLRLPRARGRPGTRGWCRGVFLNPRARRPGAGRAGSRLTSIPGAVIQLRSGLLPEGVYRRDLGGCQLRSGAPRGDFIQPGHAEPLAPYTEPQVTNISSSTLSDSAQEIRWFGFRKTRLDQGQTPGERRE